MTLTEFLLAQIAEDFAIAARASNAPWTALTFYPTRSEVTNETEIDGGVIVRTPSKDDADAEHIARHDPARVMAECEAKRRILMEWRAAEESGSYPRTTALRPVVLALAGAYADHSDYQDEWKPMSGAWCGESEWGVHLVTAGVCELCGEQEPR